MRIIQHGKIPEPPAKVTKRFKCILCECIFEADNNEHNNPPDGMVAVWQGHISQTKYYSTCPDCGALAEEAEA